MRDILQGGLRAVVWTDALQAVLMFVSQLIVLYLGAQKLGGWANVWEINNQGQRIEFFK
jgi:Na+/proline symporter